MSVNKVSFVQIFTNLSLKTAILLKTFILFILIGLCFSACKSQGYSDAELKRMAAIIVDLQRTESKINRSTFQSADSNKIAYKVLEKEIFKKHNTDSARFSQDFNKLALNKEKMLEVYKMAEKEIDKKVKFYQGSK